MASLLKQKTILFFLLLLIIAVPVWSDSTNQTDVNKEKNWNRQRIIPLSSSIYDEMDRLYLLEKKALPSTSRPWSADEADKIYRKLSSGTAIKKLSGIAASTYIIEKEIYIKKKITQKENWASAISANINLEANVKTNKEREEWEHGYEERKPLLHVPFEVWFLKNLYATAEITLKEEYAAITHVENNYTNIPTNFTQLDWHLPFRAFMSVGGEYWNIQFGRDKASWGAGATGNLMLSDYSDFYSSLRFTAYGDKFKFTTIYMGLEPWLTDEEQAIEDIGDDLSGDYDNFSELSKIFLGHRFEWRPLQSLSFALSETIIFGNKYINFTDLNPTMIFHNLFAPQYSNVMLAFEADYTPFTGVNFYMQFAMDEFQIPGLESEDSRPGASGLLVGATAIFPALDGFFTVRGEGAYTDPYLYNRWHPLTQFTNRRRLWSYVLNKHEYITKPIGYEHGPDAVIAYLSVQFDSPGQFSVALDGRYSFKGEHNKDLDKVGSYVTGKEASNLTVLSGTVERELVLSIHGKYILSEMFSFASDIYYIHADNWQNISGKTIDDVEFVFSASAHF